MPKNLILTKTFLIELACIRFRKPTKMVHIFRKLKCFKNGSDKKISQIEKVPLIQYS